MDAAPRLSLKKGFLYALIGSVSCSALLGILAILMGDFGDFEIRILLTTLTISGASICGLSCGAVLEAKRAWSVPAAGIVLAVLAALLIIAGMWFEVDSQGFWKTTATIGVFAVASSHVALLLLARLSERFGWAIWAAHVAVFFVATVICVMLWGHVDNETAFRVLGVAAILDAAITIVIPVFHRLSRNDLTDASGPILSEVAHEIRQLELRLAELHQLQASLETAARDSVPAPR
jgi:hypothetical protein